jgi:hypothetical protein
MTGERIRGSEKLLAAWKARVLTEASVHEIANALDNSPAEVESVRVIGGQHATGVQLSLSYEGDDVPRCGNDILFWLRWHQKFGGVVKPPRIIINGTPFPDLVNITLGFGQIEEQVPSDIQDIGVNDLRGFSG